SKAGGLITYSEMAWGKRWGYIAGWFQTVFYYPAIVAILSFVASIYLALLFGINDPKDPLIWLFTLGLMIFLFLFNIIKTKLAGGLQNITLVIKISALLILALTGLFLGKTTNITSNTFSTSSTGLF